MCNARLSKQPNAWLKIPGAFKQLLRKAPLSISDAAKNDNNHLMEFGLKMLLFDSALRMLALCAMRPRNTMHSPNQLRPCGRAPEAYFLAN